MDPVTLALIMGGASLGGGAMGMFGQRSANKTNIKLAREGQQFELDMWNKNNKYNDPLHQMKRLTTAGLNPNLMYGGGSASTGLSSSYPKAHVATVQNTMMPMGSALANAPSSALNAYMDLQMKTAQINATNNQADLTQTKNFNESLKSRLIAADTNWKEFNLNRGNKLLPFQYSAAEEGSKKIGMQNKDLLWKLQSQNPEHLKKLQGENRGINLSNQLKTQQLTEVIPQLMGIRNVKKQMDQLMLDFESGLKPYNQTASDNYIYRLIPKLGEMLSGWKDNINERANYDSKGNKKGQKYRGGGGSW